MNCRPSHGSACSFLCALASLREVSTVDGCRRRICALQSGRAKRVDPGLSMRHVAPTRGDRGTANSSEGALLCHIPTFTRPHLMALVDAYLARPRHSDLTMSCPPNRYKEKGVSYLIGGALRRLGRNKRVSPLSKTMSAMMLVMGATQ